MDGWSVASSPSVPLICVIESGQHWFRYSPVAYSAPSQYLNWCWIIVNWTLRNKLQWQFNQNTKLFIHENAYENIFYEMAAILSKGQCIVRLGPECSGRTRSIPLPLMSWPLVSPGHQRPRFCIFVTKEPCLLGGPFTNSLTLITAWINNSMLSKVWDEITHPFPNFSGCTVQVWEWVSCFIPHFIIESISYPCWV